MTQWDFSRVALPTPYQIRAMMADRDDVQYTCRWCGVGLMRASLVGGRGVEWWGLSGNTLGNPGAHCTQAPTSPRHQPDLPDLGDPVEIEAWLDGVREGL